MLATGTWKANLGGQGSLVTIHATTTQAVLDIASDSKGTGYQLQKPYSSSSRSPIPKKSESRSLFKMIPERCAPRVRPVRLMASYLKVNSVASCVCPFPSFTYPQPRPALRRSLYPL